MIYIRERASLEAPPSPLAPPGQQGGRTAGEIAAGIGLGALLLCAEELLAHLDIGSIEIPERGESRRQSLSTVPDPQGLEMA